MLYLYHPSRRKSRHNFECKLMSTMIPPPWQPNWFHIWGHPYLRALAWQTMIIFNVLTDVPVVLVLSSTDCRSIWVFMNSSIVNPKICARYPELCKSCWSTVKRICVLWGMMRVWTGHHIDLDFPLLFWVAFWLVGRCITAFITKYYSDIDHLD